MFVPSFFVDSRFEMRRIWGFQRIEKLKPQNLDLIEFRSIVELDKVPILYS